jgi:hypothetical protein
MYYHCFTCKRDMDISETIAVRGARYRGACDKALDERDTTKLTEEIRIPREYFSVIEYYFTSVANVCAEAGKQADHIARSSRNALDLRMQNPMKRDGLAEQRGDEA